MIAELRSRIAEAALAEHREELPTEPELTGPERLDALERLERSVENLWDDYLQRIELEGRRGSHAVRGAAWVDTIMRTEEVEYLDLAEIDDAWRAWVIGKLHGFNRANGLYGRVFQALEPLFRLGKERGRTDLHVLDLGSGAGGLPIEMSRIARKRKLPYVFEGSDIQQTHVDHANERARKEGHPVGFRRLNAFDLAPLEDGHVDVLTCVQTIHHFRPGQVAKMMAEAVRVARVGFLGVDVQRHPVVLGLLTAGTAAVTRDRKAIHDAWVTARRAYAPAELELFARAAVPSARIRTWSRPPFSYVEVVGAEAL